MLLVSSPIQAGAPDDKTKAEVAWARGVVSDFLDIVNAHNDFHAHPLSAHALMTPEYAAAANAGSADGFHRLVGLRLNYGYQPWTIKSEEVAPNGSEVIFIVVAKPKKEEKSDDEARIAIRVAKESEKSKWNIRLVTIKKAVKELPILPIDHP